MLLSLVKKDFILVKKYVLFMAAVEAGNSFEEEKY